MAQVMTTIAEMLNRLRDVERIGHDLKIIGLNAGVEAAKTTQGGRVLSVLARAIQELSTEVGRSDGGVRRRGAPDRRRGVARRTAAPRSRVDRRRHGRRVDRAELEGLLANLRAYSGELEATIGSLVGAGDALSRGVEEISMRIERQERDLTGAGERRG